MGPPGEMKMRSGETFQDEDGYEWILVPTPGEDDTGHWAGPFETREAAVAFCPIFGQWVEATEKPDGAFRYSGGAYA